MGKLVLLAALMIGLTSMLLEAADYVPRGTADIARTEYLQGVHCMEGMTDVEAD